MIPGYQVEAVCRFDPRLPGAVALETSHFVADSGVENPISHKNLSQDSYGNYSLQVNGIFPSLRVRIDRLHRDTGVFSATALNVLESVVIHSEHQSRVNND